MDVKPGVRSQKSEFRAGYKAKLDDAILHEWAYKPEPMRAMLVAVLRRAKQGEFSALDLPLRGAEEQGGTGIAGSVIHVLLLDGLIEKAIKGWIDGEPIFKTVRNDGGNPINVYRLAKPGLAQTLLERHGAARQLAAQEVLAL